ncbi:hypothetical protein CJ739_1839 [Mariniflexile rhizosphaerae]|uniref:DUF2335 domain-containing protein n=1 Tax=unclassified Mariniflexile TaxID=2643887 RepID=UPI000CB3F78F|nr:DUF2335 domain-containing protein [Mariniflexile sp. TRM1-10]AXP80924.1 hypothetical protein CJ739_1839 [Mariniflexile sp. TRM1-10]PLB19999.1 MAG: putative membrane protein [Flavobacteriaceae bacterium FS1-H7996/R]
MSEALDPINEEEENDIPQEIQEILNDPEISDEKKEKIISVLTIKRSFSGPLPSPEVLQQYNNVVKDGAERVVKMAENQSKHRMDLEDFAIKGQIKQSGRGQIFGFTLALLCIASTVYLATEGYETLAIALGTTTVIGLASIFVLGKIFQSKDKE